MCKFKEGDIVVCIDNYVTRYNLTLHKYYTVLNRSEGDNRDVIWIINDIGKRDFFGLGRFISLMEFRNNIIDEVLNDKS